MDRPPVTRRDIDYFDVQGLVRFGYRNMTEASYALVRVKRAEAARSWLRSAPITSATTLSPTPSTALQVAFTAPGLRSLGVSPSVLGGFSDEFRLGMTEPSRSRRLGDIESNAPGCWAWGGTADVPHLLVMFFGGPGLLSAFIERSTQDPWSDAFGTPYWLHTGNLSRTEPFGFADGISQPTPDWFQERDVSSGRIDFSNVVALGEFLLGYRNEYDKYTDRPLLDADATTADLVPAEEAPEKKDLGRNGTYLVIRQLQQDVRAFWRFFSEQAGGDFAAAEKLAAAFVGRTTAGDPLAPIQEQPIPGIGRHPDQIRQNQFTYAQDPAGVRCPIGAHVRRANPRNGDYFGRPSGLRRLIADLGFGQGGLGDDLTSPVRLHRILRRGREYGPRLSPADTLNPTMPDDPERGLHFICLNANISRQFEFLQQAWMTSPKFSGLAGENDPLVGSRAAMPGCPAADSFTMPQESGLPRRVSGLPQFVTVRGGAYLFLPGLRALRYFARA
jgi:deferrochelatase/peroxidase EfeB